MSHVALFGRGERHAVGRIFSGLTPGGFAYDGGSSHSVGVRALHCARRFREDLELTTIYAFSGALVPSTELDGTVTGTVADSPDPFVGGKQIATRVPEKTGTRLTASYKWISRCSAFSSGCVWRERIWT